ncbi:MAG: class I SAM-dependent methyltransferase, partial [Fimbriimonadaceae bacterium]|nr:class I SAM-dependent methyltransferase [Fimbriimonadaceae bacterium]
MAHEFPESQRVCPSLDTHQLEMYKTFRDALYSWNERKNLTRVPIDQCDIRHFAESLLVADFASGSMLDLGTGPGFPAWPLACALPELEVVAIDSNGKMLDFLRSMPLPNLTVVQGRIEEQKWEEKFGLVT